MKNIKRNAMTGLILLTVLALIGVGVASALPLFKDTFNTKYGTAGTRIDSCVLCHTSVPFLNPYGQALNERGVNGASTAGQVNLALTAIEPSDSDEDGFSNIFEINNRLFPGNASDHPINAGLTLNGTIDGTVRNASSPTRAPIAGATVTAGGITVTTNDLGKYDTSIAPGTYTMTVNAAGFATTTISNVVVTAGNRTDVDFDLAVTGQIPGNGNGTIVGTVINNQGAPISGASLSINGMAVITDAAGNYSISIAPGEYNVTASAAGFIPETEDVTVAAGVTVRRNFELLSSGAPGTTGRIDGTVRAASSRQPIAGASVTAGGISATTTALGKYEIDIAPGTYAVTANASGFASSTITNVVVTAGNKTDVDFDLGVPGQTLGNGTIVGTVTTERVPVAGASVTVNGMTAITDAGGNYSISIAPGEYNITASKAGFIPETEDVTVAAGVTVRRNLELQTAGPTVTPAPERFFATIAGSDEVPPVATTASGQAFFELVNDGAALHYRVDVSGISNVTFSHIHLAPVGVNGQIVMFLYPGPEKSGLFTGVLAEGTVTAANLTGPLSGQSLSSLIANMSSGNTYVNVHTVQHGSGEIRGQIRQGQLESDVASYDDNRDDRIDKSEAVRAIVDYFSNRIQKAQAINVVVAYFRR